MRLTVSGLARRLFRRAPFAARVESDCIVLTTRDGDRRLGRDEVRRIAATSWWRWDTLRVEPASGRALVLRGLPKGSAARAALMWDAWGLAPLAGAAARDLRHLLNRDAYFNRAALVAWRARNAGWGGNIPANLDGCPLPVDVARDLADCRDFLARGEQLVAARNDDYVRRMQRVHAAWFAAAGGAYGLTDEQQEAILRDEDNCLVVAGAGTGKTSTVAGKVAYLLRTGAARPDQVLLLSFTRKAVKELAERIGGAVGEHAAAQVRTATFHGLGVDILAHSDGVRPSVSKFAEDPVALAAAIKGYLAELLEDPATQAETVSFLAYGQFPHRTRFDFANEHEHLQYVRDHDLRTLKGERVKSHEELMIANWLHLHGVAYEYERPYAHPTATVQYRQYKPDFYLPEHDLYLEHFGIGRAGETAPNVDREQYQLGIMWKLETHQRFGTRLVETFSHERADGVLLVELERKLREQGVAPRELSPSEVLAAAEGQRMVDPLAQLLATFLNLFKGNRWTVEALEHAARQPARGTRMTHDAERGLAFLGIFRHVLARHEAELAAAGEIDFNDMISRAAERVAAGRFVSPWTHVIVDEFQDLSRGRSLLLQALLAQVHDRRLFCVGDDWQSIYRFAGSDIEQMIAFGERFGFTRRCDLTRTHRFNTELLAASSTFVQANPSQLRKTLTSGRSLGAPAIEVLARQPGEAPEHCLDRALARIADHATRELKTPRGGGTKPSVLLLGRYNVKKPDAYRLIRQHPELALDFLTVHRSKGLERDYTVVLDVVAGRMGFPSEVVDDPVLDLVLAGTGEYPNAEERRLFYVALTRARHRCVILTDASRRSKFVEELEGEAYRAWVVSSDAGSDAVAECWTCGGGRLVRKEGKHGPYWRCANAPLCDGWARACPECKTGPLVREGGVFQCHAPDCGHSTWLCPGCRHGALVVRSGEYGTFFGCSEWKPPGAGPSCDYRQKLQGA